MNELEEQIMQYEKDSIAYETGRSKVEPNNAVLISPNELLILLNKKNAEISRLNIVYQLAVAECVKATNERDLARHSLNECRRERDERSAIIHEIMDFDIEDYIQSLPWSDDAKDYEKTLVAGNLRRLFFKLVHQDATLIE